jgi:hypothetical protein
VSVIGAGFSRVVGYEDYGFVSRAEELEGLDGVREEGVAGPEHACKVLQSQGGSVGESVGMQREDAQVEDGRRHGKRYHRNRRERPGRRMHCLAFIPLSLVKQRM